MSDPASKPSHSRRRRLRDSAPQVKPWERRTPVKGDDNHALTYQAVGEALTAWNMFETTLATLFCALLGFSDWQNHRLPAQAFGAVQTFEGKLDVLRGVYRQITRVISERKETIREEVRKTANDLEQDIPVKMKKTWREFAKRRNEIAHGIVTELYEVQDGRMTNKGAGWALCSNYYDPKKRDVFGFSDFRYTSVEIVHFRDQFRVLAEDALKTASSITLVTSAFSGIFPPR